MRAALYTRTASVSQRPTEVHDQLAACRVFAERENIEVVAAFEDARVSSKSAINGPGFLALMQAATTGAFDVVICEGMGRLSRSQADIVDIFENFRARGVSIISIADGEVDGMQICLKDSLNAPRLKEMMRKVAAKHQLVETSPPKSEPESE